MSILILLWFGYFLSYHIWVLAFAGTAGITSAGMAMGLFEDSAWVTLLAFLSAGLSRARWGRWFMAVLSALLTLFLVVAGGFARLYQRPFSFTFVRLDTGTIWKENLISGIYELGLPHLLLLAGLGFILVVIFRRRASASPLLASGMVAGMLVVIAASIALNPLSPDLSASPLSAALYPKQGHFAMPSVEVSETDLIPRTDARDPAPFLRPVYAERKAGRNIIFYYLESTPFSVVGKKVNGKEVTPHLNRWAARSLFFTRHYANFPLSINAFYNSFCSAYALPDGAWVSLALPDFPVPCLSQVLSPQGYRAAALHAGYLGYAKQKRFIERRGFSFLQDAETIKKPPFDQGMGPWGAADERAMIRPLTEFASRDREHPYLALLFAFAPHHPYNKPDDFPDAFTGEPGMKKSQVRYLNSLHFADAAFGEIFAQLEKSGVLENTIVVIFGDHGEAFYEHAGNYNHPFFLYEENIHVPLLIWYNGVEPQKISRVTSHVDILPTVLDLLGQEKLMSPLHAGRSMLRGGAQSLAHIQAYWQEEYSGIVDQRYKYIRKENGSEELFDLIPDAAELDNLAAKNPEITSWFRALTQKAFAQKKLYYKKYGNYDLTRFNPASQDR